MTIRLTGLLLFLAATFPAQAEPAGWLRDWAVTMREGINGHLDGRHPVFHDAWKGTPIKWTGANPAGTVSCR